MSEELTLRILALILIAALMFSWIGAFYVCEGLKAIILRYEALLKAHGIPHSRREHGPKGFYGG